VAMLAAGGKLRAERTRYATELRNPAVIPPTTLRLTPTIQVTAPDGLSLSSRGTPRTRSGEEGAADDSVWDDDDDGGDDDVAAKAAAASAPFGEGDEKLAVRLPPAMLREVARPSRAPTARTAGRRWEEDDGGGGGGRLDHDTLTCSIREALDEAEQGLRASVIATDQMERLAASRATEAAAGGGGREAWGVGGRQRGKKTSVEAAASAGDSGVKTTRDSRNAASPPVMAAVAVTPQKLPDGHERSAAVPQLPRSSPTVATVEYRDVNTLDTDLEVRAYLKGVLHMLYGGGGGDRSGGSGAGGRGDDSAREEVVMRHVTHSPGSAAATAAMGLTSPASTTITPGVSPSPQRHPGGDAPRANSLETQWRRGDGREGKGGRLRGAAEGASRAGVRPVDHKWDDGGNDGSARCLKSTPSDGAVALPTRPKLLLSRHGLAAGSDCGGGLSVGGEVGSGRSLDDVRQLNASRPIGGSGGGATSPSGDDYGGVTAVSTCRVTAGSASGQFIPVDVSLNLTGIGGGPLSGAEGSTAGVHAGSVRTVRSTATTVGAAVGADTPASHLLSLAAPTASAVATRASGADAGAAGVQRASDVRGSMSYGTMRGALGVAAEAAAAVPAMLSELRNLKQTFDAYTRGEHAAGYTGGHPHTAGNTAGIHPHASVPLTHSRPELASDQSVFGTSRPGKDHPRLVFLPKLESRGGWK